MIESTYIIKNMKEYCFSVFLRFLWLVVVGLILLILLISGWINIRLAIFS